VPFAWSLAGPDAVKVDRVRWDARYRTGDRPHDGPPSGLLRRWLPAARQRRPHRARPEPEAPARRRALDVATGLGRNACYLATRGYEVDAVDISETALRLAARRARRGGLPEIRWIAADLDRWRPARGQYDVVVNAFFLNRRLFPALRAAVRPGGLLIFETHLAGPHDAEHPGRSHRLRHGELRRALRGWTILYAKDGMVHNGERRLALGRIVARRPAARRRAAPHAAASR
jgi:tellurite methyltransferase